MAATWKKLAYNEDIVDLYGYCYYLDGAKVDHSLATAANDFLVASGSGVFAKQTLAQTQAILGLGLLKIADVSLSADASKTISSALVAGKKYKLVFTLLQNTSDGYLYCKFNNDVGANYYFSQSLFYLGGVIDGGANPGNYFLISYYKSPTVHLIPATTYFTVEMLIHGPTGTHQSLAQWTCNYVSNGISGVCWYGGAADLNRFDIGTSAGTLTGTVTLYELL